MRLDILDHGHRLRARLFMSVAARRSGVEMADIAKTLLYRPEFFGAAMVDLSAELMRGPALWTPGEREYMAARTARLHDSAYCLDSHSELTRIASHGEIDPEDPASARPELTAVVELLERVTQTPEAVAAVDLQEVRDAGVSDEAVIDALYVGFLWNIVNRLAHAFAFELRDGQLHRGTRSLHRFGYRFPRFLTGSAIADGTVAASRRGDRHGPLVEVLRRTVLGPAGETDASLRAAALEGAALAEPWDAYTAKVRDEAARITDGDVDALVAAGHREDAIFELTVAAAVGAALRSLDAGLHALRDP